MAEIISTHPPHFTLYRLPPDVIAMQRAQPLLADLYVMTTGYFPQAAGHLVIRDTVEEYIIIYCVGGQGWYQQNDKTFAVQKGHVAIVFPGTSHAYGADTADPWTIHWAHFNGGHIGGLLALAGLSPDTPLAAVGERLNLVTAFNEILKMLRSGYSLHYLINAAASLRQILSHIALINTYSPPPAAKDLNVETIINYMVEHVDQPWTLDDFAGQAFMSRSHFSRKFHQKTGYAPIDYFIRLKIQKACELLETTDMKVGEISFSLGYKDQYYFSRIFKTVIGVSPRQYRIAREM